MSIGLFTSTDAQAQDPVWTVNAPESNWFGTGNTERGLGFNPATGNLIVASRQGGVTPILIDAATGDSVGILKNKDITFSENFEGISASGDAVTGWVFTNAQTWVLGGYGNNSDKYAGWGESVNGDHSIQSPLVTNPGVLSFYIAGYNDATNTKVVVETSPDGTTWTSVDTLVTKGAGGDIGVAYVKKSYNLNKTGDYYIRWSTTAHVDGGFYLDDIELSSPISGGTFPFNQIKATTDGQIFTANLAIGSTTKIYRWADETAEPELVFSGDLGGRLGDSFGVYGENDQVRVLLSGSGADKVEAFDWDGSAMTHAATFPITAGEARGGFSSHVYEDSVIITGTGTAPRLMSLTDGGLSTQFSSTGLEQATLNSSMLNDFAMIDGEYIIVMGPAFTDGKFYMFIPGEEDYLLEKVGEIGPLGNNPNLNNTGGVIFNEKVGHLYLMDTNNQLAAYNVYDFMPEPEPAANLIFSEYIEGTSNNKAIEIANIGDFEANLAQYRIAQSVNGGGWEYYHMFPEDSYLDAGLTYVLLNSGVSTELYNPEYADEVLDYPSVVHHNGDDARAIIRIVRGDTTVLDVFGDPDNDPGSGWDVAGVSGATANHTLVRKGTVMAGNITPLGSFGTSAEDSEWEVRDVNDFSDLGYFGGMEPVNVIFQVNTSTMPDTLQDYHFMQIRGGFNGPDVADAASIGMITWDSQSRHMYNMGGDYWWADFPMSPGDTLNYKFWAGVNPETPLQNGSEQGWESGGNNVFILPNDFAGDTVVTLQFYETREAPYPSHEDSVTLYFKVNVGAKTQLGDFDPENDKVGVRGNPAFFDNPADWSSSAFYLEQTSNQGKNLFYGGYARMHKDSVANIEGEVGYKFVLEHANGDVTWESTPDRMLKIPEMDSTIHWVYFQDEAPTEAQILSTTLNFEVNVGILEGLGYFNSSIDTVYVRGTFNGWGTGNQMDFNSFSGTYEESAIPFNTTVGADVGYKYFIKWDASRDDESSSNYLAGITHDGSGWEEPGVTGGGDRYFQIVDAENQPKRSEFFNGVEPKALMTSANVDGGAMTINFSIDMSPAVQNTSQPFDTANDSVYLFVDTPFFALTNGITVPGDGGDQWLLISDEEREKLRFTDDDGDMIYELALELQLPTLNHIGFRVSYGEPTSDDGSLFTHGSGFAAGRRHYQYVQPIVAENGSVSWPSSYTMPTLTWKVDNLDWETPPDYNTPTTSSESEVEVVREFALNQNYPNPFNPTTNISFSLADAAPVKLTVYNLLGQEVATLISGKVMNAGTHTVAFNASSLSSGVYIYRLEAGSFVSNKRMTLIK